jgi:hypothetical protein
LISSFLSTAAPLQRVLFTVGATASTVKHTSPLASTST